MLPLWAAAALFVLIIGLNAPERPRFEPLTGTQNGLVLNLRDSAAAPALNPAFVPASDALRAQVQSSLARLEKRWEAAGIRVSVAPDADSASAQEFAGQLQEWLASHQLAASQQASDEAFASRAGADVIIRCQPSDGVRARELALAMAPLVRGEVSILFSTAADAGQFDLQIRGVPQFSYNGVAHFPDAA
jgi:hypothetical protein